MIDKILEKYEKRVEYFAENPVNQEFSIRERLGEIDIMKEFLGAILISKQFRDYQILSASQTLYEA